MNIHDLKKLSGVANTTGIDTPAAGSNISLTGNEKAELMRKHNIRPGTDEWFKLWFSRPYLTNEQPIGNSARSTK